MHHAQCAEMTASQRIYTLEILPLGLAVTQIMTMTQITDGPEHMQVEMVPLTAAAA
jgi:hypothetical protein